MKYLCLLMIAAAAGFSACNAPGEEKKQAATVVDTPAADAAIPFTAKIVGWQTSLPAGWTLVPAEESKAVTKKGIEAIESSTGTKIDVGNLQEVLNLKKDAFNTFICTVEPFTGTEKEYREKVDEMIQMIANTYNGKGIQHQVKQDNVTIGGIDFNKISVVIYKPGSTEVLMWQTMYNRIVKGYDFSMTLNYNNPADKAALEGIVNKSKFIP